jgi:hypothetical protein
MLYYLFDNISFSMTTKKDLDPEQAGSLISWPPGSGSVIQDCGSKDQGIPDTNEIFADEQHCL